MKNSFTRIHLSTLGGTFLTAGLLLTGSTSGANGQTSDAKTRPTQTSPAKFLKPAIQVHGVTAGHRPVHAKGIVCEGTFTPSAEATTLSKAPHFQKTSVPVIVRLSDGSPELTIPDTTRRMPASRGMAIRFELPNGEETDIVAMSHNGFVVGTGEEFLALQKSIVATDPSQPHPWPVEKFVVSHPRALKFVVDNKVIPASFATEAFFGNDAFIFVNKEGAEQAGRYQTFSRSPGSTT